MSGKTISTWTKHQREMEKFEKEVKAVSLYLRGWIYDEIAGEVGYKDESAVRKFLEDDRKNGKLSEFPAILSEQDPDEEMRARQSIVKRYLGTHLLDPMGASWRGARRG